MMSMIIVMIKLKKSAKIKTKISGIRKNRKNKTK
jgi:hypothetical protein